MEIPILISPTPRTFYNSPEDCFLSSLQGRYSKKILSPITFGFSSLGRDSLGSPLQWFTEVGPLANVLRESQHQDSGVWSSVLVSFPALWRNSWDNQRKRRKDLFWLMVSEVSIHSQLALLFGDFSEAEDHGRKWYKTTHLMATRKQRERKWPGFQYPFQGHVPNDLTSFH
jgi:hypothetical protein